MKKKFMILIIGFCFMLLLIACTEETTQINIDVEGVELTLIEGDTYQMVVTSNDQLGLIYSVNKAGVITLSDTGFITALHEGNVEISVKSKTNSNVIKTVQVNVRKAITLISNQLEINMIAGDTNKLIITSNDSYIYNVINSEILTIDDSGLITAKKEGTTTIIVTSVYDPEVSITITVSVDKSIQINVPKKDFVLVVGDTEKINATSNDGLTYVSGDLGVVTVSSSGELTAVGFGTTTVKIISTYNEKIVEEVNLTVYKYTEAIEIEGSDLLISGMSTQLEINSSPAGSYKEVIWESSDEEILTVDNFGIVTAIKSGDATIIAKSILDDTIVDTINISVINLLIVDESKQSGDTYNYQGLELQFGKQLFSSIDDAINNANPYTLIKIIDGIYAETINIDVEGLYLEGLGENVIIKGIVNIQADSITLNNLIFEDNSIIRNLNHISNFNFINNTVRNINQQSGSFIYLTNIGDVYILNNNFSSIQSNTIEINDFNGDLLNIEENTIDSCDKAIILNVESLLDPKAEIRIFWNNINNIDVAFDINMLVGSEEQDIFKVARFNVVNNYNIGAIVNENSKFDLTLNYWGATELNYDKFINVSDYYLKGFYTSEEDVLTKLTYNPTLPIIITVTNPIDEILIGDTYTFEYQILPYELSDAKVRFITGNPSIIVINQEGQITPLTSGETYIQVRSDAVSSIRTQVDFRVITTPGIELVPSTIYSNITVGDEFDLDTILFPYTIENETASIISSAPIVATVDENGHVITHGEGLVTFTASLDSDPSVNVDYTIYVFGSLDTNNLLDYLTSKQITYSEIHKWTAYGFQYNYFDTRAESVSRYYFGDIVINDSKLVPVTEGIRPGEPMDPLPDGITQYNPYNVYWIVVHDTASTATGSNALAHANYLYNNAMAGNKLWVSWHFTVDDHDIYQHLPEIERGYHAGDGSTGPGEGNYLGGGNRNGIGIEMAVNDDGDMYRTWQRTAKLAASLLIKYNLPLSNQKFHNDFSGKDCPRTLRNAGLVPLFEEFMATEYYIGINYPNAVISMISNNPEYLDNYGRIIKIPQRAITVSYTITVNNNGETQSRTFYTYIPGSVR